ncbi:uncharacterized protein LOC134210936 [Armigeres subalbatus]|uniref:uncharacterized protein LOC134210936 n=1 Tax=Armigeres subalbatus TaxID=124917 RepID=UPI002ED1EB09
MARNIRASEMRRSSAAGLNAASQRPPLPPKIENRCHSYEGLLREDKNLPTEGQDYTDSKTPTSKPSDTVAEPVKPTEESIKAKNRRSRSMDDLFDDDRNLTDFLENTQSMENLASEEATVEPQSPVNMMGNICFNRRFVEPAVTEHPECVDPRIETASPESCGEQPCENETITVDSTPRKEHDNEDKLPPEDDVLSTNSSLNSFASASDTTSASKKSSTPFINRYVKKVKSLMKK